MILKVDIINKGKYINEALLFTKDDNHYLAYCHVAALMKTKVTKMEQAA